MKVAFPLIIFGIIATMCFQQVQIHRLQSRIDAMMYHGAVLTYDQLQKCNLTTCLNTVR